MSLGNDSFNQSGHLMNHNSYNMQGMGLSPNMFESSGGPSSNSNGNRGETNRMGNLSQAIPPPDVHQNEPNTLSQLQKHKQEQLQELRYLQQQRQQREQQQQRQSRSNQFTSKQEQEIIRNATAVMGNDFQQQQPQPTKMHMDQLRINRLKEKRKLLEAQILHQRQLELIELQKMRNQQQQNQSNHDGQQQTSSEMKAALQMRLGAIYNGADGFLEQTPLSSASSNQMLPPSALSSQDVTAELAGNPTEPIKDRRSGLVRENSLKMESVFDNGVAPTVTTSAPKKNFNQSASGMSMSATSLSLGFDEEGELSALFDTSMKMEGRSGYATTLNDRGTRTPPRSPRSMRDRLRNSAHASGSILLGMSMTSFGAEKSNSSMSCDSSLSRLFDDTVPSK